MSLKIKKLFLLTLLLPCLALYSCGDKSQETAKEEEHHDHEEGETQEAVLTDEQLSMMGIELAKVSPQNIAGYIKVTGEVKINSDQESKVGGLISGRVNKINVKEGSYVRAGQVLATIENVELVGMQADYVAAKNELEYAKQEFERQQRLSNENIGSKRTLAELEANYRRALTNVKAYEQRLAGYKISKNRFNNIHEDSTVNVQRYFSITAPISGSVISRLVTVGQFVDPSQDMFYIVNTSSVYVDLDIFEQDLEKISIGQDVIIEASTYKDETFKGKVQSVGKMFNDQSRTVKVRVVIDNKEGRLLPNMFITAKIYVKSGNVLAVPKTAIEQEGEEYYVYIKSDKETHKEEKVEAGHEGHNHEAGEHNHEGHKHEEEAGKHEPDEHSKEGNVFIKVLIRKGIEDDNYTEVFPIGEIKDGDEVVSKGTFYIKSEMNKGELGEHDH